MVRRLLIEALVAALVFVIAIAYHIDLGVAIGVAVFLLVVGVARELWVARKHGTHQP